VDTERIGWTLVDGPASRARGPALVHPCQCSTLVELAQRLQSPRNMQRPSVVEILLLLEITAWVIGGVIVYDQSFICRGPSHEKTAAKDVAVLAQAVEMYRLKTRSCPTSAQDLISTGLLKKMHKDPWDGDYVIICPGERGPVYITSAGQDREFWTDDDINSWE
jgi:general secretion pathway protein G